MSTLFERFRKHQSCSALINDCSGQSTVEYLIVGVAILMIIAALGVFVNQMSQGILVTHAADSASHAMTINSGGSLGDVLLY